MNPLQMMFHHAKHQKYYTNSKTYQYSNIMDTSMQADTIVTMENWDVVAALGDGVYVTDGETAYQVGGHYTDESANKQLKRDYAKLYNEYGGDE